jgi:hypothetical protein
MSFPYLWCTQDFATDILVRKIFSDGWSTTAPNHTTAAHLTSTKRSRILGRIALKCTLGTYSLGTHRQAAATSCCCAGTRATGRPSCTSDLFRSVAIGMRGRTYEIEKNKKTRS